MNYYGENMQQDIINSDQRLKVHIENITKLYNDKKYLRVGVWIGKDRTVDQNRLSFDIYRDLFSHGKFESITEARAYCKLNHGVPILWEEDQTFREGMSRFTKYHLTYETKLAMMIEPINLPVTSRMTRNQFSKYVESISAKFPGVDFRSLK